MATGSWGKLTMAQIAQTLGVGRSARPICRSRSQIPAVIRSASLSCVRWRLRAPRPKVCATADGTAVSLNARASHVRYPARGRIPAAAPL